MQASLPGGGCKACRRRGSLCKHSRARKRWAGSQHRCACAVAALTRCAEATLAMLLPAPPGAMVLAAGTAAGLLFGVEPLGLGLPGVWYAMGLLMVSRLGTMMWRYQSEDGPLPPSGGPRGGRMGRHPGGGRWAPQEGAWAGTFLHTLACKQDLGNSLAF